jgi:hypothetical protein
MRRYIVLAVCVLCAAAMIMPVCAAETYGAESNPTGSPIGGGKDYKAYVTSAQYRVKTPVELVTALQKAASGEVIYVEDGVEMNLTEYPDLVIPAGVTLAGGRGHSNHSGALLYTTALDRSPLLLVGGEGVRVTGLRVRGPDQQRRTKQMKKLLKVGGRSKENGYYSIPNSNGIVSAHSNLEVDNCEIWGWSHGAIYLKKGKGHYIHHNFIHHNQRSGLGYGVCHNMAVSLVEANIFDWCRHAIAATGRSGGAYEARYNIVLKNANGHSFDMHGGKDRKDGTNIAGDWMKIHHNTFNSSVWPVVIRGIPNEMSEIHHNWFVHPKKADKCVLQYNAKGNLHIYRNQYSKSKTIKDEK